MKFIRAIARSDTNTGDIELQLPVKGNEAIWLLLADRIQSLLDVLKRERIYNLIAVDHHKSTDTVLQGSNHWMFPIHEVVIDISATGHISLLLQSKQGRLHWPAMTLSDLHVMKAAGQKTVCAWCACEGITPIEGAASACAACSKEAEALRFADIDLRGAFRTSDGSHWQKITLDDALCTAGGSEHQAGQSTPFPKDTEVSIA